MTEELIAASIAYEVVDAARNAISGMIATNYHTDTPVRRALSQMTGKEIAHKALEIASEKYIGQRVDNRTLSILLGDAILKDVPEVK